MTIAHVKTLSKIQNINNIKREIPEHNVVLLLTRLYMHIAKISLNSRKIYPIPIINLNNYNEFKFVYMDDNTECSFEIPKFVEVVVAFMDRYISQLREPHRFEEQNTFPRRFDDFTEPRERHEFEEQNTFPRERHRFDEFPREERMFEGPNEFTESREPHRPNPFAEVPRE
jgi:hypothetical protein